MAQHQSFVRAAEALFITSSGLGVLIRELENQLGFRLFDRTTRRVALTASGAELLAVSRSSLQDLDAAMSRIRRAAKGSGRSISAGATPLVAANILPQAIKEFHGQQRDLRIALFDGDLATIMQRVEARQLDMGLGIFRSFPGGRRTPFFPFALMVIRADKKRARDRASTTWAALTD